MVDSETFDFQDAADEAGLAVPPGAKALFSENKPFLSREEERAVFAELYALRRETSRAISSCPLLVEEVQSWAARAVSDIRFLPKLVSARRDENQPPPESTATTEEDNEDTGDQAELMLSTTPSQTEILEKISLIGFIQDQLASLKTATGQKAPYDQDFLVAKRDEIFDTIPFRHAGLQRLKARLDAAQSEGNEAALQGSAPFLACLKQHKRIDSVLFEHSWRLIYSRAYKQAKKYELQHLSSNDLFHEGCISFLRAVEGFDVARGVRFATYLVWWVDAKISRAIQDRDSQIRIPCHRINTLSEINKVRRQAVYRDGVVASPELVAAQMGLDQKLVESLMQASFPLKSLDAPIEGGSLDSDTCFLDILADNRGLGPEQLAERAASLSFIQRLLSKFLQPKEEMVITRRFGLDGKPEETLEEIGARLHVTRERIRQIEARALGRLKKHPVAAQLRALRGPGG